MSGYGAIFCTFLKQQLNDGGVHSYGAVVTPPPISPPPPHPPQSQDPPPTMALGVAVLHQLLQFSAQLPGLARDIGTDHIPGLLTSLLGLKAEVWGAP